jgi:hypothetical protein
MLTIRDVILHHIKASGPCSTDSIVSYLDQQCCDPEWAALKEKWDKRNTVRTTMTQLCQAGKASVYSNVPAVCWW